MLYRITTEYRNGVIASIPNLTSAEVWREMRERTIQADNRDHVDSWTVTPM